jgi:hypothetical protein
VQGFLSSFCVQPFPYMTRLTKFLTLDSMCQKSIMGGTSQNRQWNTNYFISIDSSLKQFNHGVLVVHT